MTSTKVQEGKVSSIRVANSDSVVNLSISGKNDIESGVL